MKFGAIDIGTNAARLLVARRATAAPDRSRHQRTGQWRAVPAFEATSASSYGPSGIIVSLIAGLLISIVLRSGEYFVAIPAIPLMAPIWARTIIQVMTIDMVVMGFLYSVCFVMALRSVPYFPRMMVLTWATDLTMQLGIASTMAAATTAVM